MVPDGQYSAEGKCCYLIDVYVDLFVPISSVHSLVAFSHVQACYFVFPENKTPAEVFPYSTPGSFLKSPTYQNQVPPPIFTTQQQVLTPTNPSNQFLLVCRT
jgi:hypothetical protein